MVRLLVHVYFVFLLFIYYVKQRIIVCSKCGYLRVFYTVDEYLMNVMYRATDTIYSVIYNYPVRILMFLINVQDVKIQNMAPGKY